MLLHVLAVVVGQRGSFRQTLQMGENLAELLDARPVPAVVEFEEVDR